MTSQNHITTLGLVDYTDQSIHTEITILAQERKTYEIKDL